VIFYFIGKTLLSIFTILGQVLLKFFSKKVELFYNKAEENFSHKNR